MKTALLLLLGLWSAIAIGAVPQLMNYQGFLTDSDGSPLDTVVSMTFQLHDAASGGTQLWTETQPSCTVQVGLFNVSLGSITAVPDSFAHSQVWLGVTVGNNSEMVPRTRFVSVPYAYRVGTVDGASGGIVTGELTADTLQTAVLGFEDGTSQVSAWDTTSLDARINAKADSADHATRTWVSSQGYVTSALQWPDTSGALATDYDVSLKADSADHATRTWVRSMGHLRGTNNEVGWSGFVGGGDGNVASGEYSTVGGGHFNRARAIYSVIAGGGGSAWLDSNSVTGMYGAVGGGRRHSVSGVASVVGGGTNNSVSGYTSAIPGGQSNSVAGSYSAILGGSSNSIAAGADYSAIAGGMQNQVAGSFSFAAGWMAQANHIGSFVWADANGSPMTTTAPNQFLIRATNGVGVGRNDPIEQLDVNGDVRADTFRANIGIRFPDGTFQSTAPVAFSGQQYADTNTWDATQTWVQYQQYARTWQLNPLQADADTDVWDATRTWVQSMGYLRGTGNSASPTSFIGGGSNNTANFSFGTVSGGTGNAANGDYATVAGGFANLSAPSATVGGGRYNQARGLYSVVSGGGGPSLVDSNSASGSYSMIPGGRRNSAGGSYSFAAGRRAQANHDGSFVWGDSNDGDVASDSANSFTVRASGGIQMYTNPALTAGVKVYAGASAWTAVSDSTKKRNIRLVDTKGILERVAQLPIKQWSYKSQDPSIEHIGPMAQDFWKQFHVGEDSLGISTIDPDGIALAAIQELKARTDEIVSLRERVEQLEKQIQRLASARTTEEHASVALTDGQAH